MNPNVSSTKKMILCAFFAALTAIFSQITLPLPFTPVPINLATLSVLMAGALLGAKAGAVSQLIYLLAGAVGLPVFSRFSGGLSVLVGPTGGYLIGYLFAALVAGARCKKTNRHKITTIFTMIFAMVICYLFGTMWYILSTHTPLSAALTTCVLPFLAGDAIKIIIALVLIPSLRDKRVVA